MTSLTFENVLLFDKITMTNANFGYVSICDIDHVRPASPNATVAVVDLVY